MKAKYVSKRWLNPPEPFHKLIRRLKYVSVGRLHSGDFILQRAKGDPTTFYLFHISIGEVQRVSKYKLHRFSYY